MNNNRSCPGGMLTDNNRRDNVCDNMCEHRDNNTCAREAVDMCRRSSDMSTRNQGANNVRCARDNSMRTGYKRNCDMRCRMDNDMSSRRGNMNDMEGFALAMAYVPWQQWGEVYPLNTGLQRGTIFPELDKPFFKGRCCNL